MCIVSLFHQLWKQPNKACYHPFLDGWIVRARSTGRKQLVQMGNTLSVHRHRLLAHYDVPISTDRLEETNSKIRLSASGLRLPRQEFFRLRMFALRETRYRLIVGYAM